MKLPLNITKITFYDDGERLMNSPKLPEEAQALIDSGKFKSPEEILLCLNQISVKLLKSMLEGKEVLIGKDNEYSQLKLSGPINSISPSDEPTDKAEDT